MKQKNAKREALSRKDTRRDSGPSLPASYKPTGLEPEKRLMLAVLADAVKCLQEKRPSSKRGKLADAAEGWILSNRRGHPFCFQELCQVLDWDPQQIRQTLVKRSKTVRGGV